MRKAVLLVLVLVLLPLAPAYAGGGCGLQPRGRGVTAYRSGGLGVAPVSVYGDSITYQVHRQLLKRRADVGVDAYWGREAQSGVDALERDLRSAVPAAVVMAVGTNNMVDPAPVRAAVLRARALLPPTTRLLWVLAYDDRHPGWRDVDQRIASVPGVEVLDWVTPNVRARGRSSRSPLLADGKHLSCAGASAWLAMLDRALSTVVTSPLPGPDPGPERAPVALWRT